MGFEECTEIQELTMAHSLKGRDVLGQSQTGTGKTAAFLITIFQLFLNTRLSEDTNEGPGGEKFSSALIIVPTRELAVQIQKEAEAIGKYLSFSIGSFYGGVGYKEQFDIIKKGVDIIIATPGRLIDLMNSKKIDLKDTDILVIDEADRLFDMGFMPDVRKIVRKLPPPQKRMTMLFSATLPLRIRQLAWEHMRDPIELEIDPENPTVDTVVQELYHVGKTDKVRLILGLLSREKPDNTLVFTNTKFRAVELSERLELNGYRARYIIGDLPQKKRMKTINDMKSGSIPILIATDVAARGLHIDDLDLVINYDIPQDPENYVHRIGRTARAGKTGKAISLACEEFVFGLEPIEELIDMKIPSVWPEESLFIEDKSGHLSERELKNRRKKNLDSDKRNIRKSIRNEKKHTQRPKTSPPKRKPAAPITPDPKPYVAGYDPKKDIKHPKKQDRRKKQPPSRRTSAEDRLRYYREKYGEDFTMAKPKKDKPSKKIKTGQEETKKERENSEKNKKNNVFSKIASLFKK